MKEMIPRAVLLTAFAALLALAPSLTANEYGEWEVQNTGMATFLTGVCFADHSYGWTVGAMNGIGPSIHYTSDGGQNWRVQSSAMLNLMYLGCDCADRQNIWVCGVQFVFPGMIYSHTGGETWETQSMPGLIWTSQFVQAVDAQNVKVPSLWTNLVGGEKTGISVTGDGGNSWQNFEWNVPTYTRYCDFIDNNRGWMTGGTWPDEGDSPVYRLSQNSPPLAEVSPQVAALKTRATTYQAAIARTNDGGKTWQQVFWNEGTFYLNQISMVNELDGWAVGEANYTPYIVHTSDGGVTWEHQNPPAGQYGLMSIHMLNTREGFAVGFGPGGLDVTMICLHTNDGGVTWTYDKPGIKTGTIDAEFLTPTDGWAVGGNNLQRSTVAHYDNLSPLQISLISPPTEASPGDTIQWGVKVENYGTSPVGFDLWLELTSTALPPQYNPYLKPLYGGVVFSPGQSASGPLSFTFPLQTPVGTYTMLNAVGGYPDAEMDLESFDIFVH